MIKVWLALCCAFAAASARAQSFQKSGNNGRSCEEFCTGTEWGTKVGMCLFGERIDHGGRRIGCEESSPPGTVNVLCTCAEPRRERDWSTQRRGGYLQRGAGGAANRANGSSLRAESPQFSSVAV